jgi:GntR family transcriptional regulator
MIMNPLDVRADRRWPAPCRIESGELEPGEPVPSITTLTQEWDVARETAAHAPQVLEAEGLVRRYPGRGYYVIGRSEA